MDCLALRREQIGTVAGVPVFAGGETLPSPPPAKPTDADVEHLRRAMVEAHQTWQAVVGMIAPDRGLTRERYMLLISVLDDAVVTWEAAAIAWAEAKRARGAP